MKALDIETRSLDPDHPEYALQPWRVGEGLAEITMVAVGTGTPKSVSLDKVKSDWSSTIALASDTYVGWNMLFDCAFLHASGYDVRKHEWIDAMLLVKWVENRVTSGKPLSYSLAACAERWLSDWEYLPQFLNLKATEADSSDDKYWSVRAKMDVVATYLIAQRAISNLTTQQRRTAMIEAGNILPNAIAYVHGLPTNPKFYELPIPGLMREMAELECRTATCNETSLPAQYGGEGWTPSKVLRSPQKLADLLYNVWGLKCTSQTDTGAPSTDKSALTYLVDHQPKVIDIMAWKKCNTILTKFCQSPVKARAYLGSSTLHPGPNIFGTYTGRYTYSSKIKNKHPISVALHQTPRGPKVRRMVEAPDDKILIELDASGQEARLLAEIGDIESMLRAFRAGRKVHAVMGSAIAGVSYDVFMEQYKLGKELYAGAEGFYYCGKFINLSMQYRVGAKKQRIQARTDYKLIKTAHEIEAWRSLYHYTYPEVKGYWKAATAKAKALGYAETLGGRRYYIDKWGGDDEWGSSSSAINFPIQGSGGDMKNLAISTIDKKYHTQAEYAWDLHDGLFYWLPREKASMELARDMQETLNNLDYKDAWGWEPRIPMPWDLSIGLNWGDMKEI